MKQWSRDTLWCHSSGVALLDFWVNLSQLWSSLNRLWYWPQEPNEPIHLCLCRSGVTSTLPSWDFYVGAGDQTQVPSVDTLLMGLSLPPLGEHITIKLLITLFFNFYLLTGTNLQIYVLILCLFSATFCFLWRKWAVNRHTDS